MVRENNIDSQKKYSVVTGLGVISPIGIGTGQFSTALKKGETNFSYIEFQHEGKSFNYPIAKPIDFNSKSAIAELPLNQEVIKKALRVRNLSESTHWGLYCALEAWGDSGLDSAQVDPERIALVCGGSNIQEASLEAVREKYRTKLSFLNPTYGMNSFDTDLIGIVSEVLGIRGEGYSVGAASASGNMTLIHADRLIQSGDYDIVLAIAPMMELSIYQYQGFTALGAMASFSDTKKAEELCRPFDSNHCGFIYGQNAGCMVLESHTHAQKRQKDAYGAIVGYGIVLDGNRNPNPSVEGEKRAMEKAMANAGIRPDAIDYVNTHGTASPTGDTTEVQAMLEAGLSKVKANSTKSLVGHGLSAAGTVEAIACCVQMKEGFLHPSCNLNDPITDQMNWTDLTVEKKQVDYVLSNSFGFGGINTSIVFRNKYR